MEKISKRLREIINMADSVPVIADIGTDHAYVPICLIKEHKADRVIATDKNTGPLLAAKKNIEYENVAHKIELRQGDGLSPLLANEANEIIISGMGGLLIIEMIEKNLHLLYCNTKLVLSPHKDVPAVRKFLHRIHYRIAAETMVYEDNNYYNILKAYSGDETYAEETDYTFGKLLIQQAHPCLKKALHRRLEILEEIRRNILQHSAHNNEKLQALSDEIAECESVCKLL